MTSLNWRKTDMSTKPTRSVLGDDLSMKDDAAARWLAKREKNRKRNKSRQRRGGRQG